MPPNVVKQIWLTVRAPSDAASGNYRGAINLRGSAGLIASVPLEVRVLPFALSESRISYAMYYRGQLNPQKAGTGSEYKNSEQMTNELIDMRDHGISHPTLYQSPFSTSQFTEVLQLRQSAGTKSDPLYCLSIYTTSAFFQSPEAGGNPIVPEFFPKMKSLAAAQGIGDFYIYGIDEARGAVLSSERPLWKAAHNAGVKVFVAGSEGAHELVGDLLDTQVQFGNPDFEEARRWHASGKKIFSYGNPQSGPENPLLFRFNYGLLLWANDYDGAMPYAYQDCFGSCWNDIDDPVYRDHVFAYPTANGVIPTLAWEGMREAVDDVRYLTTLEEAIAGSQTSEAQDAQQFLNELREKIRGTAGRYGAYNQNIDMDLDGNRAQIIQWIEAITGP